MSMTQRERMILKGIEDELTREDPLLCARLATIGGVRPRPPRIGPMIPLLALAVGIIVMVFGAAAGAAPVAWTGLAVSVVASSSLLLLAAHRVHGQRRR